MSTPVNPTTSTQDVKMRVPSDFDGNNSKTRLWLVEIEDFLEMNEDKYDNDKKKITFALSFMSAGNAASWKFDKWEAMQKMTVKPTWPKIKTEIEKTFLPIDDEGQAATKLMTITQGDQDVESYIAKFWLVTGRLNFADEKALVRDFQRGLNPRIVEWIWNLEKTPTIMNKWYNAAALIKGRWRWSQAAQGKSVYKEKKADERKTKETKTVTIARLSDRERIDHIKCGLCFVCHKQGHLSCECPDKKRSNTSYQNPAPQWYFPKFNQNRNQGMETHAKIKATMAELEGEDKQLVMGLMEEEGF